MFKPAPKRHPDVHDEPLPPNIIMSVKMPDYPVPDKREEIIVWVYRAAVIVMLGWLCVKPVLDRLIH